MIGFTRQGHKDQEGRGPLTPVWTGTDGLTKSLLPLNLWTNLVDAVGLVPGPNEKGQNWIKNFLNQIQKEEELKELAQLNVDPDVRSKKGSCQ